MPVIMNPVDLLNQASDYTTELTWKSSSNIKEATFFYLKTPTSNPDSNTNLNLDWGDSLGKGKIDTSNLYWRDAGINTSLGRVKNAYSVNNNVSEWPSGTVTKDTINNCYEITKDTKHWNDVFQAYKSSIMNELKVTNITEDDISSIILKPYKFSMNNEPDGYHVDCKIEVKCKKTVTATFYVQDASQNQDRYYQVESKNYKTNDTVEFPNYTDKDGYDFSGWYQDEELKNAVPEGEYEITDNVSFYAKYTPKTYTVTWRNWDETVVQTNENVEHGTTVAAPTNPTRADDDQYTYTFKHWSTTKNGEAATDLTNPVTADRTYYAVYGATEKENPSTPMAYKIIQHFRDGKGNPSTANPDITTDKTTTDAQATLDSLITDNLKQSKTGTDGKTYVYVPSETKFTVNSGAVTALVDGTEIHLYYYLDEVGGPSEKEGADTPDNIPDAWQYKVTFKVVHGKWNNETEADIVKYVTKKDNTGEASATGTATLKKEDIPAVGNKPAEGFQTKGSWSDNLTATADNVITKDEEYTFTYVEKEPVSQLTYSIKLHLIDESGKDSTTNIVENQTADAGKKLNDLITADVIAKVNELKGDKNYVSGVTKVNGTTPLVDNATLTANVTTIDLYYYLDNWKDGDEAGKDSETGGDSIPDCDQVLIKYVSSNSDRGTVSPDMEVLTIRGSDKQPTNKGTVKASGSTATVTGSSRNYFSNWTDKTGTQVSTDATLNNEAIQKVIKEFTGGKTYTFIANFGRSSGGSSRPSTPPTVDIPDDVPTGLNGKDHYAYIIGYGNNDVRPQNNITRAEVATIFFRLLTDETRTANMTKSNGYNDVKDGDWFCCAVSTLSKMGIIKGYEDGSFKPNDPISRAKFAAIAARFDPDGDKTPATFADVTSHWAKDEISIAANHGWIKGYEDGSFKPDQKITRAETMTLVNRVLNRLPETKDDLHKDMKTWVDNMDETAWYYLAVQEATNSHYFKNKTSTKFEQWTDLRDTRDWSELEK